MASTAILFLSLGISLVFFKLMLSYFDQIYVLLKNWVFLLIISFDFHEL